MERNVRRVFFLILFFSSTAPSFLQGQHIKVGAGTWVPQQYSTRLEYQHSSGAGVHFQYGALTKPYDALILRILEKYGTDPTIIEMIEGGYEQGRILQPALTFEIGKNVIGAHGQRIALQASEASSKLLETYYDIDLSPSFGPFTFDPLSNVDVELTSTLYQLGLFYERRIPLRENLELRAGISLSRNLDSENEITIEGRDPEQFSEEVRQIEKDLHQTYLDYGWLPSINLMVLYRFGWE